MEYLEKERLVRRALRVGYLPDGGSRVNLRELSGFAYNGI